MFENPGWTTQVTPVPSLVSNHNLLCPVHPLPAGDRPGETGVPPQLPGAVSDDDGEDDDNDDPRPWSPTSLASTWPTPASWTREQRRPRLLVSATESTRGRGEYHVIAAV